MSAAMVAWRRKIVNWNCPQWLEILLTFIEVGHVTFYHKLKNCLRLTSQFPNFSAHREIRGLDAFFDFLIMKVNVPIISGSFRVNWKFIIKLKFHAIFVKKYLNSNWHLISCSYSSIPAVLKLFRPLCCVQNDLFITFTGNRKFWYPRKLVSSRNKQLKYIQHSTQ